MREEKIMEKKFVPVFKVRKILKERGKEAELGYEQELTLKYADKFSKLTPAKYEKLFEELQKLDGVTEEIAVKMVDLLPRRREIIQLALPKGSSLSEETMEKILKLTEKFAPKEKKK